MLYLCSLLLSVILASGISNISAEALAAAQLSPKTLTQIETYQNPESKWWNASRLYPVLKELQDKGLSEFLSHICADDRFPVSPMLSEVAKHLDTSLVEHCLLKYKQTGHADLESALHTAVKDIYPEEFSTKPKLITMSQVETVAEFLEVLLKDDLCEYEEQFIKFEMVVCRILAKFPSRRLLDVLISNRHMPLIKTDRNKGQGYNVIPSEWYYLLLKSIEKNDITVVLKIMFFWPKFQQAYDLEYIGHAETHILSFVLEKNPNLFPLMTLQPGLFKIFMNPEIQSKDASSRWLSAAPDSLRRTLTDDSIALENKHSTYLQAYLTPELVDDVDFACYFAVLALIGISDDFIVSRAINSGHNAAIQILLDCNFIKVKHLSAIFASGHFDSLYSVIDKKLGSTDFFELSYSDSPAVFILANLMCSGSSQIIKQAEKIMQMAGLAGNMKTLQRLSRLMGEWQALHAEHSVSS